ncbi:ankyrin repeat domain-containing protein [Mesorhizobium sp. M0323]|uniref:ankyrin repeat domain-containing protein n=1 Tax=Mesorhizobium sp. M0323 TaxID=2956938 RepID=UPI003335CF63
MRIVNIFSVFAISAISSGYCNERGELFEAILSKNTDKAEVVLKSGYDANCTTTDGVTPLLAAVNGKDISMVELILKYHGNPNTTYGGASPLYFAAIADCVECAEKIISYGGHFLADQVQISYLKKYKHTESAFWQSVIFDDPVKK